MADLTVKRLEDLQGVQPTRDGARRVPGSQVLEQGGMLLARSGLGVGSFGMQVLRLPPSNERHPEHDHAEDGQEEVYFMLDGSATLHVDGEEYPLERGVLARVGPGQPRRIITGDEPALILALGGVPGGAYEPPSFTDEREPDGG